VSFALFSSMVMMFMYGRASNRYRDVVNALDSFAEFDAAFKERWKPHLEPIRSLDETRP
jgi:hypothetical protein